jgi:four helix bundle protein
MAGFRHAEDFIAWQLADRFKDEVFRLVRSSVDARRDLKYRSQIQDAAASVSKNITEGFLRHSPQVVATFLDYALGSLGEASGRLQDGVELAYFPEPDCLAAFRLARRCSKAIIGLKHSQLDYARRNRRGRGRNVPNVPDVPDVPNVPVPCRVTPVKTLLSPS